MSLSDRLIQYAYLVRLHKPIGTVLLLWPTLWALWFASQGQPSLEHVIIFSLGTLLMRSAGCAVNDFADRDFDRHVKRTEQRPLTAGKISGKETLMVAGTLALIAFALVLRLNWLTIQLSFVALLIAVIYPFTKRFFSMPQAILGVAFGFGIPMTYAAELNTVPWQAWLMLLGNIFWAIAYDTAYAMVDRDDDVKIGIKTSAITFGQYEVTAIVTCYILFFSIMAFLASLENLNIWFWSGWGGAILCAVYHYTLVKTRDRMKCFAAFNHNNWLGAILFLGVALAYYFR
ncbi:4-hydroxybenzoate octaprenyltransferase [Polynucleobacter sp. SHI8]|uniref:4-hydroxybenzoate octaprenyltransferase n=1 Tax=unclassified Polynucleobacter TaxID=2640945 RepID=UPI002492712A|nr:MULTISPECIES: 4-hydroxybenzoate octaprenyltransferase [unclassified Polynucleobacter]BDW11970.1 4-hydroxybenzoate octaprenyltransferase [Polynucleobacter sp. SHI2]BDW14417.1 4-hydroxybenzoate octaprenyltransferase [Polynucleobacter sp. SHI8]